MLCHGSTHIVFFFTLQDLQRWILCLDYRGFGCWGGHFWEMGIRFSLLSLAKRNVLCTNPLYFGSRIKVVNFTKRKDGAKLGLRALVLEQECNPPSAPGREDMAAALNGEASRPRLCTQIRANRDEKIVSPGRFPPHNIYNAGTYEP